MNQPKVELSVEPLIRSTIQAMERVTSAILSGSPAGAGTITGKKMTAQYSFNMRDSAAKHSLQEAARRKIVAQAFQRNAVPLERAIKRAVETLISNMAGLSNTNIQVFGRSLGNLTSKNRIEDEPFAKFIKTQKGAGEIGLPDPDESIEQLKTAIVAAITVDVVVRSNGPQVRFRFDQRKLLKLTPHPDRFEPGPKGAFYSWLSILTGPDYVGSTPGYALVRVNEMQQELRKISAKTSGLTSVRALRNLRKIEFIENVMNISRTRGYAGEMAAVMLRTSKKPGTQKTQAELFGGKNKDYQPSKNFNGFWDKWWLQRKQELSIFVRRIIGASVRALLKG